jgi:hypothetical protein
VGDQVGLGAHVTLVLVLTRFGSPALSRVAAGLCSYRLGLDGQSVYDPNHLTG